jgi:hypothetical protein
MPRHLAAVSCALLLLAGACQNDAENVKPPNVAEAFPSILLPPNSRVESQSGSEDALQLVFQSVAEPEVIVQYYRARFSEPGWSIVSDLTDSTGATAIHVDWNKTQQPMWVRIVPNEQGTRVELTGAVPTRDSSYVRRAQAAKDSSNSLRPR